MFSFDSALGISLPAIAANRSVELSSCMTESSKMHVEVNLIHKLSVLSAHFTHSGVEEAETTDVRGDV